VIAEISGTEVAAILAAVFGVLLIVGFFVAFAALLRSLRTLLSAIDELRRELVPLAGQWRSTVDTANAELTRVDGILTTAESVGATVDSASRLAYLAFSNPVIKTMAIGSGTAKAYRALRRNKSRSERG